MGSLLKNSYTIDIPPGASVKNNAVTWETKGKRKSGTLTKGGKVLCQSDVWIAQFVDEEGKLKRVSTKTKDRAAANRVLVKLENEVEQVRAGVLTRIDIDISQSRNDPLGKHLDDYFVYQSALGTKPRQITDYRSMLERLFEEAQIKSLQDIQRSAIDKWILFSRENRVCEKNKRTKKGRGPRTINSYLDRLRTFCRWCVEERRLKEDPTAKIKDQNEAVDQRKQRRSLTNEEIELLLVSAKTRSRQKNGRSSAEEIETAYRTMLGTGLRSTEAASLVVHQIDAKSHRIDLKPRDTKNKKGGFQPITRDLALRLEAWVQEKSPNDKLFNHTADSLRSSFIRDCKAAGIELKSPDGRSIDVHSLRRTFGTMLARAGVPLTTTQRLMRHSTPELTAKLYIDVEPIDMQQAVDKLPAF